MHDTAAAPKRLIQGTVITLTEAGADVVCDGVGLGLADTFAVTTAVAARLLVGTDPADLSACGQTDGAYLLSELDAVGLLVDAAERFGSLPVAAPSVRLPRDVTCCTSSDGLVITRSGWCAGARQQRMATARLLVQLFDGFSAASLGTVVGTDAAQALYRRLAHLGLLVPVPLDAGSF